jgi:hypothetical protein
MKKPKESASVHVDTILNVTKGVIDVQVVGDMPLICNRLSEKARHELLFPAGRRNQVERAITLKHDPYEEYRQSPYRLADDADTAIGMVSAAFKKSIMAAALDLPGTNKAQMGRLVWVRGQYVPVFGVPQILLSAVRNSDQNHTPDIRSRAILPRWACSLTLEFVEPLITREAVVRCLAAAGLYIGVGDWRNEKGAGTFGSFRLVSAMDAEFQDIVTTGRRSEQLAALNDPMPYDLETTELLGWFDTERVARQQKGKAKQQTAQAGAAS